MTVNSKTHSNRFIILNGFYKNSISAKICPHCPRFLKSLHISILCLLLKIQSPSSRNNECGEVAHDPPTATNKTDHHQRQSYLTETHLDTTCNFVLILACRILALDIRQMILPQNIRALLFMQMSLPFISDL